VVGRKVHRILKCGIGTYYTGTGYDAYVYDVNFVQDSSGNLTPVSWEEALVAVAKVQLTLNNNKLYTVGTDL
jgi:hypothetical protein